MDKLRVCFAEFIGTFALIFVGIGAIKTAGHEVLGDNHARYFVWRAAHWRSHDMFRSYCQYLDR